MSLTRKQIEYCHDSILGTSRAVDIVVFARAIEQLVRANAEQTSQIKYEAACSGLQYTKPSACGEISAIWIGSTRHALQSQAPSMVQSAPTASKPEVVAWVPITKPGQVKVGDKLRFTLCGDLHNRKARQILNAGTDQEEIIYDVGRNYYLITSWRLKEKEVKRTSNSLAHGSAALSDAVPAIQEPTQALSDSEILDAACAKGHRIEEGYLCFREKEIIDLARSLLAGKKS